jgi:hypothetical protein
VSFPPPEDGKRSSLIYVVFFNSVGIVRSWTKATEFVLFVFLCCILSFLESRTMDKVKNPVILSQNIGTVYD